MKNTDAQSGLPTAQEDCLETTHDGIDADGANGDSDIASSNVTLKRAADYQALLDIHLINSEKALSHNGPSKSA